MADHETYVSLSIETTDIAWALGFLEYFDVSAIQQSEKGLQGFWPVDKWTEIENKLISILTQKEDLEYKVEHIPFQNWNEKWESEFEPIYINNFCCVRAPFHDTPAQVKHDIIIEPKMAFGTGHHATTYLMIKTMKDLNIDNKRVLDYGTGTGILAILAEQMHAEDVIAIDNDLSAYENTLENIEKNNCTKISVQHAVLSELKADVHFDHILANINRNVLLESVEEISRNANLHAQLLLSGFYKDDLPLIKKAYSNEWVLEHSQSKENWCCAKFKKKYP